MLHDLESFAEKLNEKMAWFFDPIIVKVIVIEEVIVIEKHFLISTALSLTHSKTDF